MLKFSKMLFITMVNKYFCLKSFGKDFVLNLSVISLLLKNN